jgi:hypothetical protein
VCSPDQGSNGVTYCWHRTSYKGPPKIEDGTFPRKVRRDLNLNVKRNESPQSTWIDPAKAVIAYCSMC